MNKADAFAKKLQERPVFWAPPNVIIYETEPTYAAYVNDYGDLRVNRQQSFNREQALAFAAWIMETFT